LSGKRFFAVVIPAFAQTRAHRVKEGDHPEEISCTSTLLFQGTGYSLLPSSMGIL